MPRVSESEFERAAFEDGHHKRPIRLCVVSTDATEYSADFVSRLLLADVVTWLNPPLWDSSLVWLKLLAHNGVMG